MKKQEKKITRLVDKDKNPLLEIYFEDDLYYPRVIKPFKYRFSGWSCYLESVVEVDQKGYIHLCDYDTREENPDEDDDDPFYCINSCSKIIKRKIYGK